MKVDTQLWPNRASKIKSINKYMNDSSAVTNARKKKQSNNGRHGKRLTQGSF